MKRFSAVLLVILLAAFALPLVVLVIASFCEGDLINFLKGEQNTLAISTGQYSSFFANEDMLRRFGNSLKITGGTLLIQFPMSMLGGLYLARCSWRSINPEKKADDDLDIDSIYETLKANFLYDSTVTDYNRDELDNILDIMVEMVCCQSRTLTISKVDQPIELVRKRVYQINYMTMQYILNSLEKTSTEPQDPKAYIMTVIFNAPVTKAVRDAPRIRNMLG